MRGVHPPLPYPLLLRHFLRQTPGTARIGVPDPSHGVQLTIPHSPSNGTERHQALPDDKGLWDLEIDLAGG